MEMNSEKPGERVFGNVDDALAERIASRARENSRGSAEPAAAVAGRDDSGRHRRSGLTLILKVAIPVLLLIAALVVAAKTRRQSRGY
jgi:hypothetical protein